jgi:hypothetical protein
MSSANATGSILMKGFNASALYSTATTEGWHLSISVRENMPSKSSDAGIGPNTHDVIGTTVSLEPPINLTIRSSGEAKVDPPWRVCAFFLTDISDAATERLQDDDGSCSSALSAECLQEVEDAVASAQKSPGECICPDFSKTCLRGSGFATRLSCAVTSIPAHGLRDESQASFGLHAQRPGRYKGGGGASLLEKRDVGELIGPRGVGPGPPAWCEQTPGLPDPCDAPISYITSSSTSLVFSTLTPMSEHSTRSISTTSTTSSQTQLTTSAENSASGVETGLITPVFDGTTVYNPTLGTISSSAPSASTSLDMQTEKLVEDHFLDSPGIEVYVYGHRVRVPRRVRDVAGPDAADLEERDAQHARNRDRPWHHSWSGRPPWLGNPKPETTTITATITATSTTKSSVWTITTTSTSASTASRIPEPCPPSNDEFDLLLFCIFVTIDGYQCEGEVGETAKFMIDNLPEMVKSLVKGACLPPGYPDLKRRVKRSEGIDENERETTKRSSETREDETSLDGNNSTPSFDFNDSRTPVQRDAPPPPIRALPPPGAQPGSDPNPSKSQRKVILECDPVTGECVFRAVEDSTSTDTTTSSTSASVNATTTRLTIPASWLATTIPTSATSHSERLIHPAVITPGVASSLGQDQTERRSGEDSPVTTADLQATSVGDVPIRGIQLSAHDLATLDQFYLLTFTDTSEDVDNLTAYEAAVRRVWPVVLTWSEGNANGTARMKPQSFMGCLRVGNVVKDSQATSSATSWAPMRWSLLLSMFSVLLAFK